MSTNTQGNKLQAEAIEWYNVFCNESRLYRQKLSIEANLDKRDAKGEYDFALSVKVWRYWIDAAFKMQGNGSLRGFSPDLRQAVAFEAAEYYRRNDRKSAEQIAEDAETARLEREDTKRKSLLDKARAIASDNAAQCSTVFLQRKLKVSHAKARELIDALALAQ